MSHDLSLAQKHAWNLARILMTPVVLFQSGAEFGVLPVDEFEGAGLIGLYLYDPYFGGEALH
ncbi:hypothetical protein [Oricola sp.]|uniref:hypothetical protein n=1 Tax=Oricola sp. TaxID=1979950 RepID=UPI0025F2B746|nr:hypothetical protein [Oricola sp.]MCI5075365.1 hypothetical protein [Oricola sp.]